MLNQAEITLAKKRSNQNNGKYLPRLHTAFSLTIVLAALSSGNDALACASCGCTLSTDWGSQGIGSKEGMSADLSYNYINQNSLIYGNSKTVASLQALYNAGTEIETSTITQTTTAAFNYNSDTWGISTQIPYVQRTHGTDGTITNGVIGENYTTSSANGIGDVRVVGRYSGFSADKTTGLILGIKLPTGDRGANFTSGVNAGTPLDAGVQIGTASTDVILGAYTTGTVSTYGWFVQGTVQHAVSPLATEALGTTYRPGDAYTFNSGIRYAGFGASVTPMLQLNFIHREYDQGTAVNNDPYTGSPISGGNLAYLSPGVTVRVGGGASVYGFVQVPVYQNVGSLQLVPSYTATVGIHQNF